MKDSIDDLIALCRIFSMFEREQVCCGTVTVQQCVALQSLVDNPSEVVVLAERLGSSPSAMTRLIDGLVSRNWVERGRDPQDRRRVQIQLTEEGQAEAKRLRTLTEAAINLVIHKIPQQKRNQVLESISLVRKAMEDAREAVQCC